MVDMSSMSFLGIFVAAVVAFMFGGLWYTVLFGNVWKKEMGIDVAKEKEMKENGSEKKSLIIEFFAGLVVSFTMAYLLHATGMLELKYALMLSFTIGLGIVAAIMIGNGTFSGYSAKLITIDVVFRVLQIMLLAAIYTLFVSN